MIPENSLQWDSNDEELFFSLASKADYLVIDTETNSQDVRDGRGYCMGISVALKIEPDTIVACYLPFRHKGANLQKTTLFRLKNLLENFKILVFHNAKFDLVSLQTIGINFTGKFYDTMLMAHWVDENTYSKSLDYLVKHYCDLGGKKTTDRFKAFIKAFGWADTPASEMAEYAANDAYITLALFEYLYPRFLNEGYEGELWRIEQDWMRLLSKMESRGVGINTNLAEGLAATGEFLMEEYADDLGFNPGSTLQLGEFFINELGLPVVKKTPKGKPCFDKEAMAYYDSILEQRNDDRAESVLAYRGWQKAVTSNYRAYLKLLSPDGRLRPNYKLHGTVTGRLSCEQPNLQQIPRSSTKDWNGRMKECFIPQDGYTLWEADYSQLELRLAAAYAKERKLLEIFSDDSRDVFSEMSEQLGMDRYATKTLTYTIQYGGGITRISHVFGVSEPRAALIKDNFYETYSGLLTVQKLASSKCVEQKFLRLWTNRRRHFPRPREEAHKAFNAAIQGGAAEIVKRQGLVLGDSVDNDECRMLLQIHDAYVFEIKNGTEEQYLPEIKNLMEKVEPDFGVKFKTDVHPWVK